MGAATYPQIVFSLGRNETRAKGAQNFGYGIFSNLIIIIIKIIIIMIYGYNDDDHHYHYYHHHFLLDII